jgi:hypothetical protein
MNWTVKRVGNAYQIIDPTGIIRAGGQSAFDLATQLAARLRELDEVRRKAKHILKDSGSPTVRVPRKPVVQGRGD